MIQSIHLANPYIYSKRHNKLLFPDLVKAIYVSFYKPKKAISNAVNYRKWSVMDGMSRKREKRRKSRLKRLLLFTLVFLAVVLGGWYFLLGKLYAEMTYEEAERFSDEPWKEDGVINILLIGNDSRENVEGSRSDAMILLTISSKTKTIQMTSLLRDIYVDIPGREGNRLNAAYAFGGPELLLETINENFNVSVNRYMLVDFEAFANLVDGVGGVDLSLTGPELEYVNAYLVEYNIINGRPERTDYMDTSAEGQVHLNGPQALAYSRNRYIGTDFGRTERQRKVLSEVIKKAPGALLKNPAKLVDGLLPNLTTNLTKDECFQLSLQAGSFVLWDLEQGSVPLEGTYQPANIRGMSVLEVDLEKNREYLHEIMYGK